MPQKLTNKSKIVKTGNKNFPSAVLRISKTNFTGNVCGSKKNIDGSTSSLPSEELLLTNTTAKKQLIPKALQAWNGVSLGW